MDVQTGWLFLILVVVLMALFAASVFLLYRKQQKGFDDFADDE